MSDTTRIILAIISGIVVLGGGILRLGFSQRKSMGSFKREVGEKLDTLSETIGRFDVVLSGYRGIGGLLLEVEKLKEEMATVDERIRTDGKHAALNAVTPIVADLRNDLNDRLNDHEARIRPLERREPRHDT